MTDLRAAVTRTVFPVILSSTMFLSCNRMPEEGEIIITADALTAVEPESTGCQIPDTLPPRDSLLADSLTLRLDSLFALKDSLRALADSLAADSAAAAVECPWNVLAIEIRGSIYASLQGVCDQPDILGAHIVRCMWWDTDPWTGMSAGDSLYAIWGEGATGRENLVLALRYVPIDGSAGEGFSAYSFRMTGDNYSSYFHADGSEVMRLLDTMPIGTFEEMTGPFGEPRGDHTHAGVDFKAPEGTTVRTCRGGTVARINWNHDYNGNCVEIDFGGGYSEIFLHLSAIAPGVTPGVVLVAGDAVGSVGSTGMTSTNAHLHYQINDGNDNPIDPYLFAGSHRRSLPAGDMDAFGDLVERCDAWMAAGTHP